MTKGVLAARAVATAIAVIGLSIGPGGVATTPPARAGTVRDVLSSGQEALVSRVRVGDRGTAVWDEGSDSGDGGDGDDGDGDDVGDD